MAAAVMVASLACGTSPALAAAPSATVSADQALRFGSFFTDTSGTRTVSATGSVTGSAIVPLTGTAPGPAQFTFTYDRGNNANTNYSLLIAVLVPGAASQISGGVTGTIASFDTDLPGVSALVPGQTAQVTLTGCQRRICSRTFRVGGTLQVARTSGGAELAIPVPIVVTVLAEL
ncbi:hypothetical protein NSE01_31620 [Novosphingobium sediminis]|uniref:Uncharacterized protein n=2 Tax=Novosphingobium sediminis TaxID=707214 RepID=A0A512ANP8_9SPHN|nr:hypothetical protein NSE01_31620 [Novosphingobium sediminis]